MKTNDAFRQYFLKASNKFKVPFAFTSKSVNGSFAAWVAKPVTSFLGLSPETLNAWLYWPLRILLIFPIYQLTLPIVGWLFGQFKFFWAFEKKFLSRLGLGFLFKEKD